MSRMKNGRLAASWNTHSLLTMGALKPLQAKLAERAPVQHIETFLMRCRDDLKRLASAYRASFDKGKSKDALSGRHGEIITESDFISAFQLNPATSFHYIKSADLRQGKTLSHDESRDGPPGGMYVPVAEGEEMSAPDILTAYSDEPDWGMDQELFREDFVYGTCPFGSPSGQSSQAPFHMAFLHESRVFTALFPDLKRSFMLSRIRLFKDLAEIAFSAGARYWGWRFTAWAVHYLQDLTQPYHARAFPAPITPVLVRAAIRPRINLFKANKNYLKNRHLIFESAIHFILNRSVKEEQEHPFIRALAGKGDAYEGDLETVMFEAAQFPAQTARYVDRLTMKIIGDPRLRDPKFDLSQLQPYGIETVLKNVEDVEQELLGRLIDVISRCFYETGKVTRYGLKGLL